MIRPVEAGDIPAVVSVIAASLAEYGMTLGVGSSTDDDLPALPASYVDRGGAFWVAVVDGVVLGSCGVFPVAPATFELRKMYLRPTARGLGLGAQLLSTAIAWCRAHGGAQLVLDTVDAMDRAIAFYEAHGFVRDDSQRRAARSSRGYALRL